MSDATAPGHPGSALHRGRRREEPSLGLGAGREVVSAGRADVRVALGSKDQRARPWELRPFWSLHTTAPYPHQHKHRQSDLWGTATSITNATVTKHHPPAMLRHPQRAGIAGLQIFALHSSVLESYLENVQMASILARPTATPSSLGHSSPNSHMTSSGASDSFRNLPEASNHTLC